MPEATLNTNREPLSTYKIELLPIKMASMAHHDIIPGSCPRNDPASLEEAEMGSRTRKIFLFAEVS